MAWRSWGDIGVRVSSFPGPVLCHSAAGGQVAGSVVFPGRYKVMMCSCTFRPWVDPDTSC